MCSAADMEHRLFHPHVLLQSKTQAANIRSVPFQGPDAAARKITARPGSKKERTSDIERSRHSSFTANYDYTPIPSGI